MATIYKKKKEKEKYFEENALGFPSHVNEKDECSLNNALATEDNIEIILHPCTPHYTNKMFYLLVRFAC